MDSSHTPETLNQPKSAVEIAGKRPAPWDRPRTLLFMAIWFGLLTGAVEALALFVLQLSGRCVLDSVSPFIWTIPLSEAAVLTILGFAFFLRARCRGLTPRLRKVALFFFCTLAVSTMILTVAATLTVMLIPPAAILLAAGIATQVVRLAATRQRVLHRLFIRTIPGMIALALLAGITVQVRYWWSERQMLRSLPPAASAAPNVLLIVLDTVRAKSMGLYGYAKDTTPNLQRWARRGVLFDQAIAPSPYTLASHASMFTGRYPHQLATDWTAPLEAGCPVLAQVLHDRGYVTVGFVANTWNAGRQTGLDRGFSHYVAHRFTLLEILIRSALCRTLLHPPRGTPPASAINADFSRWLAHSPRRPFFAFLNYNDCHAVYEPEPQDQTFSREERRQIVRWSVLAFDAPQPETDSARLTLVREAYDHCLRGLDRRISALLQGLEDRGDLKNTIVIIVGDHGEQFGEHNLIQHADSLYRPALHVPLLIIAPNSPAAGQRVHQMVTLRDLPATILDLLQLPHGGIPGDSFAAAITNSPDAPLPASLKFAFVTQGIHFPGWHPNADGPVGAVFLDGKYYIRNAIQEELYDFQTDPDEQHNLIDSPDSRLLLDRLRRLLPTRAPK
jgi:arylsulfatase A-like enzyme